MVEAVLTRSSRLKNKITKIMKEDVKIIENAGVPCFDIFFKGAGSNSSLLMAIGVLEALSNPAFAVVANARSAPIPNSMLPPLPKYVLAPREIGMNESWVLSLKTPHN